MHVVLHEMQAQGGKNILKEKTIEEKCATYCHMVNERINEVEKNYRPSVM